MPLAGAAAALELGPHLGAHDYLLFAGVGAQHGQLQKIDEGGVAKALLQLIFTQRRAAHGVITSLPKTSRSSRRARASGARSSEKVSSMTASNRPARTMSSSAVISSRAQPFEPRIFSSNVQIKRMSSGGS